MSEKRRAAFIINFQKGRAGRGKLEIFRKSSWTGVSTDRYTYRIRLNNRWINGTHNEREYVDQNAIIPVVRQILAKEDIL